MLDNNNQKRFKITYIGPRLCKENVFKKTDTNNVSPLVSDTVAGVCTYVFTFLYFPHFQSKYDVGDQGKESLSDFHLWFPGQKS